MRTRRNSWIDFRSVVTDLYFSARATSSVQPACLTLQGTFAAEHRSHRHRHREIQLFLRRKGEDRLDYARCSRRPTTFLIGTKPLLWRRTSNILAGPTWDLPSPHASCEQPPHLRLLLHQSYSGYVQVFPFNNAVDGVARSSSPLP